ncbi:MAG TPA: hypothetical protein VGJ32_02945 [Solirubrobacteraceae bacterium]
MGQRERRRQAAAQRTAAGYARGRERDEAARAALKPLAPGERPVPVTVAAVVATVLAVGNLALFAAGVRVRGSSTVGVLLLCLVLGVAAFGLWRVRYWAVLGFEALLALTIFYATASLVLASSLRLVAVAVPTIVLSGWLFWKLVGVMSRLQMPGRDVP